LLSFFYIKFKKILYDNLRKIVVKLKYKEFNLNILIKT